MRRAININEILIVNHHTQSTMQGRGEGRGGGRGGQIDTQQGGGTRNIHRRVGSRRAHRGKRGSPHPVENASWVKLRSFPNCDATTVDCRRTANTQHARCSAQHSSLRQRCAASCYWQPLTSPRGCRGRRARPRNQIKSNLDQWWPPDTYNYIRPALQFQVPLLGTQRGPERALQLPSGKACATRSRALFKLRGSRLTRSRWCAHPDLMHACWWAQGSALASRSVHRALRVQTFVVNRSSTSLALRQSIYLPLCPPISSRLSRASATITSHAPPPLTPPW